ncbi:DUF445 domain-containing protein [Bombella saccharophila]|uniref:DUF445 domain-containing protein n=1 Tax=Bombella saccharophila TaxID=2967338 RepID=A0ABT3W933_9PROT|nr:DUF445 domain-containing protein [Bombella saccharophila]MCX5614312.1 DUF445 domain-containing protein [Bombella saccharophila]PHI95383.1 hypothetical protein BG621_06360 [Parasaccharibacter apium]
MSVPQRKNRVSLSATLLLAGASGVAIISRLSLWQHLYGTPLWLDMLQAGSQAGVVGGVADWFAVTALFRHPLGLPIPHTAILPQRKAQLGSALGRFMVEHFLTKVEVIRLLEQVDLPVLLARFLQKPEIENQILRYLRNLTPAILERIGDGRGSSFLVTLFPTLLKREDVTALVLRGFKALVDEEIHQEVFSFFLAQLKEFVTTREEDLRSFVEKRVKEQGGRLIGWAVGTSIATQVLAALRAELGRVDPMDSDLRHGFTRWVRTKIQELEDDPQGAHDLMESITAFFSHESVKEWSGSLWQRLRIMVEDDSARDDGLSMQALRTMYRQFVEALLQRTALSTRMNHAVQQMVVKALPAMQDYTSNMIERVITEWDAKSLSARLEAGIGRDLAYIRVNGTVVGFVVGALLEALLVWLVP